jgi:hypothetical protein
VRDAGDSGAIPRLLASPRLPAHARESLEAAGIAPAWFADHLRELALGFADAVLSRRRQAAALDWPAVRDVYRLGPLVDDAAAAAERVWRDTLAAFQRLALTGIGSRRLGLRGARRARLGQEELQRLRRRVVRPAEPLRQAAEQCARATDPQAWAEGRARLEECWADAWEGVSAAVVGIWTEEFARRLASLRGLRPGLPAWALVLVLGLAAILALLAVVAP